MDRLPVLAWMITIVALILLAVYFSAPVERVLLSFDVSNTTTAEEIDYVVSILEERGATATFFVSGYFALENEALLRNLSTTYEIGCRGMTGSRLPELNQTEMEWEILECKHVVENITNKSVLGFRAPQTLIDERAFATLHDAGFLYDTSSFENLGWFSPPPTIAEVSLSSWGFIPLSWYKPLGDMGYFLMKWDKDNEMVFGFSPKHVNAHRGAFEYLLESYDEDVLFMTYAEAAETQ